MSRIATNDLVILDYSDATVHTYRVEDSVTIDEHLIEELGHRSCDCHWMCGDLREIHHKAIVLAVSPDLSVGGYVE